MAGGARLATPLLYDSERKHLTALAIQRLIEATQVAATRLMTAASSF
jgi:hypothetical protein